MSQESQTARREGEIKQKKAKNKGVSRSAQSKPSVSRIALGVTAASGASLVAIGLLGLGPVLVAGTAGFLAYQGMTSHRS